MTSEAEVNKQIRHMVSFMEQEAAEKANEIMVKAEEEFNIEKGRIVQQEKKKIQSTYEKKEKQVDLQRKIVYSNELNKNRLQLLESQNKHVNAVIETCRLELQKTIQNKSKYQELLTKLILEGMFSLLEDNFVIECRKVDQPLVEAAYSPAKNQYNEATKKSCTVKISPNYLPDSHAGGVYVCNGNERIKCDQTLESRLEAIGHEMAPSIRLGLFGPSKSRVHFD